MTYKNILVHVPAEPQPLRALEAAAALAQRFDARLIGVGAETYDIGLLASAAYVDAVLAQALRDQVELNLKTAQARFLALAEPLGQDTSWLSEVDFPSWAVAGYGRCADIAVAARPGRLHTDLTVANPADLVMQAGLPVLLVPEASAPLEAKRIVIGWKDTREARRALSDALPFVVAAEQVVVAGVAGAGEIGADRDGLEQVAERLRRHGALVKTEVARRGAASVAETLETVADEHGADLLVLGAYGHTRIREWVFGGVTEELMAASSKYVLFSH